MGICTASKAVSAVVLSHLIHTVFPSVFTALALARRALCRSTSNPQRSAEHCPAPQPPRGYLRAWLSQASHILWEKLLITRHSLSVIITQRFKFKKEKLEKNEGGKKKKILREWISWFQFLQGDIFNCLSNSYHWAYPQHPPALSHLSGEVVEGWWLKDVWASKKERENMRGASQG